MKYKKLFQLRNNYILFKFIIKEETLNYVLFFTVQLFRMKEITFIYLCRLNLQQTEHFSVQLN